MDKIEHGVDWIKVSLAGAGGILMASYRMQIVLGGVLAVQAGALLHRGLGSG